MFTFSLKTKKKIAKIQVEIDWEKVASTLIIMVLSFSLTALCEYFDVNLFTE